MESNGDVLEAIASTSRATRLHKRVVQSTPYQRVQALLGQRAPAPATRTRGRPAMGVRLRSTKLSALQTPRLKLHVRALRSRARCCAMHALTSSSRTFVELNSGLSRS